MWFKAQQKKAGVTTSDIAEKIGRDRSIVSHIYSGRQKMSLDWAQAFSDVLNIPIDEVLKHAGVLGEPSVTRIAHGFSESDAAPFSGKGGEAATTNAIAKHFGGGKPGIDIWVVQSDALALRGYLPGDFILLDTHQSERCKAGDTVIAQIYNWQSGTAETVLRHYEPPVLLSITMAYDAPISHVVDGQNVIIKGKVIASWRR